MTAVTVLVVRVRGRQGRDKKRPDVPYVEIRVLAHKCSVRGYPGAEKVSPARGVWQGELNKKAPLREGASMRRNFARVYDTEARVFPSEAWGRCRVSAPTCYFPSSLARAGEE